ncbi:MAG: hypothetical protein IKD04_09060 [Clostridia bacterium]|nr:hypothetical protein [Clostridia bacterium]
MEKKEFKVWIDETQRLVSFHSEQSFSEKTFDTREDFVSFILIYGNSGYRFK